MKYILRIAVFFVLVSFSSCATNRGSVFSHCDTGHNVLYMQSMGNHILVSGVIKSGRTKKASKFANIILRHEDGAIYNTQADRRGHYALVINKKYFDGMVEVDEYEGEGSYTI